MERSTTGPKAQSPRRQIFKLQPPWDTGTPSTINHWTEKCTQQAPHTTGPPPPPTHPQKKKHGKDGGGGGYGLPGILGPPVAGPGWGAAGRRSWAAAWLHPGLLAAEAALWCGLPNPPPLPGPLTPQLKYTTKQSGPFNPWTSYRN